MCKKIRNIRVQTMDNAKQGKSGFTLVELCVALALLTILTTMTVSFSVLMNGFAAENKAEYEFIEDHATLKESLCTWVSESDVSGSVFSVSDDGTLTVSENGIEKGVSFADGLLTFAGEQKAGLDAIDGVTFTANGKLIKCVTYRIAKNGERIENSFVFSLRCGTTMEVADEE